VTPSPVTGSGTSDEVVDPFPSSPSILYPVHSRLSSASWKHECWAPAVTVRPFDMPKTYAGVEELLAEFVPS